MLTERERLLANLNRRNIPGLDGLRGIAALSVVAFHDWSQRFPGRMAVQLFFVISGLLITWLLLQEEDRHGAYSILYPSGIAIATGPFRFSGMGMGDKQPAGAESWHNGVCALLCELLLSIRGNSGGDFANVVFGS